LDTEAPALSAALDAVRDLSAGYVEALWKVLGFQLLTIGWLLTSNDARRFLHESTTANNVLLVVVIAGLVGHSAIILRMWKRSRSLTRWLERQQIPAEASTIYELTVPRVAANYSVVFTLFILMFVLTYAVR